MGHIFAVGMTIILNVLFFRESAGGPWIAQALEKDIAAQGESIDAAKLAFERTVFGYLAMDQRLGREALSGLKPAPEEYWDVYRQLGVQKRFTEMKPPTAPDVTTDSTPAFMIAAVSNEALLVA